MIHAIKSIIKKILPEQVFSLYHLILAHLASILYKNPSESLIVIGVTGTKGKTTAANFIWSILTAGGYKTGLLTTANIKIGEKELLNKYHMTMPGRFAIQKLLREMVEEKCKFCIIEVTSEGIKQSRHKGINFDVAVFTNLYPEHLPSHGGSFEKYKQAKGELFRALSKNKRKNILGTETPKTSVVNGQSKDKDFFLSFPADQKITFGFDDSNNVYALNIKEEDQGVSFFLNDYQKYKINIDGKFNVENALSAVCIGQIFGISKEKIKTGLEMLSLVPGRMEKIDEGQDFDVYVDYAHQKESFDNVVKFAKEKVFESGKKVIVLFGAEGGGRDKTKREKMAETAARFADFAIVSNVDPYDDDPKEIVDDIVYLATGFGMKPNKNLFGIEDRRSGIKKALELAKKGDVVLITGKGAEQSFVINGKKIPWDDRTVVREELKKLQ